MTTKGHRRNASVLAGHGQAVTRGGRDRPFSFSQRKRPILLNAAHATTGWTATSGCTLSAALVAVPEGVSEVCVSIAGSAANTNAFFTYDMGAQSIATRDGISFDFYYPTGNTYANLGNSGILVTVFLLDATFGLSLACTFQVGQGWNHIRLGVADFATAVGGATWTGTTFRYLRFKVGAKTNVTHACSLRNVCWRGGGQKLQLVIRFDDIGHSVYDAAYPIMKARGLVGTNAVISDAIGQSAWNGWDRCSAAQLREMNANGWDCALHTKSHQLGVLPTDTQANCFTEIDTCRTALRTNGLGNGVSENILFSPYGEYGANYYAAADQAGLFMFCGTVGDAGSSIGNTSVAIGDVIYSPVRQFPSLYIINTTTTAYVLACLDLAIARGGVLVMTYHHVETPASQAIQRAVSDFTADMDGVAARAAGFDSVTISTAYDRCRQ